MGHICPAGQERVKQTIWQGAEWIHLPKDKYQWWVPVITVTNESSGFIKCGKNSLQADDLIRIKFSRKTGHCSVQLVQENV